MSERDEIVDAEVVEEEVAPAPVVDADYNEAGVPSFEYVRGRIEGQVGVAELADNSTIDEQLAERDRAGREKLEEIRRAMRGE